MGVVKMLIEMDRVEVTSFDLREALDEAAKKEHERVVKLLTQSSTA